MKGFKRKKVEIKLKELEEEFRNGKEAEDQK